MKVEKVTYERLFRTGEYENERIGVTASVDATENPIEVCKDLKVLVFSMHEEGKQLEEQPKPPSQPLPSKKPTLDEISSLFYVDKTGDKGPFKQASKQDNPNNPAFTKLQKHLQEHKGFAVLHGFKFWTFSNNPDIIGRRKK